MNAPPERQRVVFRCDASAQIGGGHVMRCLTLANALSEAGAQVTFVAAVIPEALAERIAGAGHGLEAIPASTELSRDGAEWEEPPLGVDAQLADSKTAGAAIGQADWLVVDHYLLDAHWHSAARSFASHILVIDDLANRRYDCDILLDQTFGRSTQDYRERVPDRARILAGATYALLRPEFGRERPAALDRRRTAEPARRILVSMGTMDPDGLTARIVGQALAVAPQCAIDAVVGPQASLGELQEIAARDSRVSIHVNTERMAELMRDADIAIGAAGTTSWERCCLGLPSIALVLAENQRLSAEGLERAGAVVMADSLEAIPSALQSLIDDGQKLITMSAAAAAVTDGEGAKLTVDAMIGQVGPAEDEPTFRPARSEDSRMVWLWRNDFITREFSQATAPIPWPDHHAWWQKTLAATERQLLVAEAAGVPVAALRFDEVGDGLFEVSINLAPSARNAGLGGRILAKGCTHFRECNAPVRLIATIHRDHPASRRIFEKLGFVRVDSRSNSVFQRYVLAEGSAR